MNERAKLLPSRGSVAGPTDQASRQEPRPPETFVLCEISEPEVAITSGIRRN